MNNRMMKDSLNDKDKVVEKTVDERQKDNAKAQSSLPKLNNSNLKKVKAQPNFLVGRKNHLYL
ncbi:MAG: hypothetical protein R3Y40_03285 [Eubacteriales bacterium]